MSDNERPEEPVDFANRITLKIYRQLIVDGVIDPAGKSDKQLAAELTREINSILAQETDFQIILDHSYALLDSARSFKGQGQYETCCLFYATWFEHWINGVLMTFVWRRGPLSHPEFKELIRGTGLRPKFNCLPQLLGLPRIKKNHCDTIVRIAEVRNSFVHYKYTPTDVEDWSGNTEQWKALLKEAEKTVRYCRNYENRQIFGGLKSALALPKIS